MSTGPPGNDRRFSQNQYQNARKKPKFEGVHTRNQQAWAVPDNDPPNARQGEIGARGLCHLRARHG
jgi:hypothetical protein